MTQHQTGLRECAEKGLGRLRPERHLRAVCDLGRKGRLVRIGQCLSHFSVLHCCPVSLLCKP